MWSDNPWRAWNPCRELMRRLRLAALVAAVLVAFAGATPADTRTTDRSKPVIFIHGSDWFAPYGVDCPSSFADMKRRFRDFGWTGPLIAVSYYRYDARCDATIGTHGSHAVHYPASHYSTGAHSGNTDIRHLAYHLAWFIYDRYSRYGHPVDIVGHSMGPLFIQYALAQVERHHSQFPPRLLVEDVVSLAAPFAGARSIIDTCHTHQCAQMRPNSTFLGWLKTYAWEPDGAGGTDWTTVSSVDDNYVTGGSGVAMGACHKVVYLTSSNVEHLDLLHDTSSSVTADVKRWNCPGGWVTDTTWYWPVRETDLALYSLAR
jgi:triacylglycerol esterase/lipase EstA (alpha/beta hydrolase family)